MINCVFTGPPKGGLAALRGATNDWQGAAGGQQQPWAGNWDKEQPRSGVAGRGASAASGHQARARPRCCMPLRQRAARRAPHPRNSIVLMLNPSVGLIVVMSSPLSRFTIVVFPALSRPLGGGRGGKWRARLSASHLRPLALSPPAQRLPDTPYTPPTYTMSSRISFSLALTFLMIVRSPLGAPRGVKELAGTLGSVQAREQGGGQRGRHVHGRRARRRDLIWPAALRCCFFGGLLFTGAPAIRARQRSNCKCAQGSGGRRTRATRSGARAGAAELPGALKGGACRGGAARLHSHVCAAACTHLRAAKRQCAEAQV